MHGTQVSAVHIGLEPLFRGIPYHHWHLKIVRAKMNRQILAAGSATLLLFAATLAVIPAIAEEQDTSEKVRPVKERPHRMPITVALGFGGAVEEDGNEIYRSHMRFAAVKSDDAAHENDYIIKRGGLVIGDRDGPVKYEVVPDTWTLKIKGGDNAFSAEGKVQDREGKQYSVSLSGKLLHDTQNGNLYFVEGKFSGDSEDSSIYKLYYLMMVQDKVIRPENSTRE